jgi:hypothetical protein
VLLIASVLMLGCQVINNLKTQNNSISLSYNNPDSLQLVLLYQWVTIREKRRSNLSPADQDTTTSNGLLANFWNWRSFSDYLFFIATLGASIGLATCFFSGYPAFQVFLGLTSSAVEAGLGVPQFLLNYRRQNTDGLT